MGDDQNLSIQMMLFQLPDYITSLIWKIVED